MIPQHSAGDPPQQPIITLDRISRHFVRSLDLADRVANLLGAGRKDHVVHAVDDVSLELMEGEILGLVGESGSGKSTLARIAAGTLKPSEGSVRFRGRDVANLGRQERRATDLAVQLVFQDSMASLNARQRAIDIIGEAAVVHGLIRSSQVDGYASELMKKVGLDPTTRRRYPHQFSGGQRTRLGIARALAVKPQVLVCDEATAALDVSVQAQVLNLFMNLRREFGLTYLFVTHDLGVVEHVADRIAVMYLGRIVELGPAEKVFSAPNHPYTRALISDLPRLEPVKRKFSAVKGEFPSPLHPPSGCHFHPRCQFAFSLCEIEKPPLLPIEAGRASACHLNRRP